MKRSEFHSYVRELRAKAPLAKPVRVRLRPIRIGRERLATPFGPRNHVVWAHCSEGTKSYYITIDPRCADPVEALIHEWAHLIADPAGHSPKRWGPAYAKLWRLIMEPEELR